MANAVFYKQAQRMLGKRRRNRRWIPVVACLVLIVAVGTFYFMMQQGQAMSWRDMELDCMASVHVHTPECLDEEGGIICGYADYLVHEHGDECYDQDGNLVCPLRQVKEHHHDETCYEKVGVYSACGLEESVGHVHEDSCYRSVLVCGQEEAEGHTHDSSCYNENNELICGMEETEGHTHTDACYEKELICGMEAGEGGHMHTDACMEEELVLVCQKPEISLHTHTDECYTFYDEAGEELPLEEAIDREERFAKLVADGEKPDFALPVRVLSCGMLQTEKHEHGNECFKKIEKEPESSEVMSSSLESSSAPESSEVESSGLESSGSESSALESSDVESGLESGLESSQPEEPEETPEPEETGRTAAYEDETLKVTATFAEEVPEGAHLVVERIEDPEQLAKRQAKLKQIMDDGEYSLHALLQVGLQDEEGQPVEFESPASITAEFFGEGAGVEGAKICAVAYRQAEPDPELETVPGMVLDLERAEVLDVSLADNGGTVTEIAEDTLLGFGSKAPVKVNAEDVAGTEEEEGSEEDNRLHLDQSFSYQTDSMFELVFHIKGSAPLASVEKQAQPEEEPAPSASAEPAVEWGEGEFSGLEEDGLTLMGMSDVLSSVVSGVESSSPEWGSSAPEEDSEPIEKKEEGEPAPSAEPEKPSRKGLGGAAVSTGSVLPANTELAFEQILKFEVQKMGEDDPAYQPYADYVKVEDAEPDTEIPPLEVLSYKLYYAGQELDLSGCEISVEVNATEELEALIADMFSEEDAEENQAAMLVSVLGPAGTAAPEESFVMYADAEAAEAARQQEESDQALREIAAESFDTEANSDVCVLDSKDLTRESAGALMTLRLQAANAQPAAEARSEDPESADTSVNGEPEMGLMADSESEAGAGFAGFATEEGELEDSVGSEASDETTEDGDKTVESSDADANAVTRPHKAPANNTKTTGTIALATNGQYNPKFTVDYYAYLAEVKMTDDVKDNMGDKSIWGTYFESIVNNDYKRRGKVPVIDTTEGKLPANGILPKNGLNTKGLQVGADNKIVTEKHLKQIYSPMECTYFQRPTLQYFDAMVGVENGSYILKQVWVLPEGGNKSSTNPDEWVKYGKVTKDANGNDITPNYNVDRQHLLFSNKKRETDADIDGSGKRLYHFVTGNFYYICIENDTTIRLLYEPVDQNYSQSAYFYDYDITGETSTNHYDENNPTYSGKLFDTAKKGINTPITGDGAQYAFGNGDTTSFTGLGSEKWGVNFINQSNKGNSSANSFEGCAFGLVLAQQAASDVKEGTIKFASGIKAPQIFKVEKTGTVEGRTTYDGGTLTFNRIGDKYTLTEATVPNAGTAKNLDRLSHPSSNYTHIWTNNFWPMDNAKNSYDPMFGKTGSTVKLKNDKGSLPVSDDGVAHNSFFGMHFSVNFSFVNTYQGPLEYLFFGDDDMWVFLTETDENGNVLSKTQSKLICDIGGVHSSVGEYVNLWDYLGDLKTNPDKPIPVDQITTHHYRLDFFYTERGASGSTCWMQFTLPSMGGNTTEQMNEYGKLRIAKEAEYRVKEGDLGGQKLNKKDETEFIFRIKITDQAGNVLPYDLRYEKYEDNNNDGAGEKLTDTGGMKGFLDKSVLAATGEKAAYFTLKSGQSIVIENIPFGAKYEVEERKDVVAKDVKVVVDEENNTVNAEIITTPSPEYFTTADRTRKKKPCDEEGNSPVSDTSGQDSLWKYNFGNQGVRIVKGTITQDDKGEKFNDYKDIQTVLFRNTVYAYELPKTGGEGVARYLWVGAGLCVAALAWIYKSARKRGKEVVHKI